MILKKMIDELISIPKTELESSNSNHCKDVLYAREAYRNSLRNSINKEIENTSDKDILRVLIDDRKRELETPLLIAVFRRYAWLNPLSKNLYRQFLEAAHERSIPNIDELEIAIQNNDLLVALYKIEELFNGTFSDSSLIQPIKLRTLCDICWEYENFFDCLRYDVNFDDKDDITWKVISKRNGYLRDKIEERIADKNINLLELREFFTDKRGLFISMDCTYGLRIAKAYLNVNPTDREIYGQIIKFLAFRHLDPDFLLVLKYVSVNDFRSALAFINNVTIEEGSILDQY